jgi:hypothetical protein
MNDSSAEEYMKYSLEEIVPDKESLTLKEAVEVLWKWRKYRNGVFWKTLYRWGATAVIITLVP